VFPASHLRFAVRKSCFWALEIRLWKNSGSVPGHPSGLCCKKILGFDFGKFAFGRTPAVFPVSHL
jgi:hypothetical protein